MVAFPLDKVYVQVEPSITVVYVVVAACNPAAAIIAITAESVFITVLIAVSFRVSLILSKIILGGAVTTHLQSVFA